MTEEELKSLGLVQTGKDSFMSKFHERAPVISQSLPSESERGRRSLLKTVKDTPEPDTRPQWKIEGFDSKGEWNFKNDWLEPRRLAGELEWFHEPVSMKLYDGSGERILIDFFIIFANGERRFVDHKPYDWIPREGRLGMSKLKRAAAQNMKFYGIATYKVSFHNAEWVFQKIGV